MKEGISSSRQPPSHEVQVQLSSWSAVSNHRLVMMGLYTGLFLLSSMVLPGRKIRSQSVLDQFRKKNISKILLIFVNKLIKKLNKLQLDLRIVLRNSYKRKLCCQLT